MRALLACVMVASLTVPAVAQMSAGRNFSPTGGQQNQPPPAKAKPSDDKEYNAALSRMQDGKYDPWRTVRGGQGNSSPTAPGSAK